MNIEMEAMTWLIVKHFVCDFPLQAFPWMYRNKGTYGHLGGIIHAAVHLFATYFILSFFTEWALFAGIIDFFIHYHIDWAKMNLGKKLNLKPDNSEWFWILLGLDQLLHYLTY